jgi:hypothetical protein
MSFLAFGQVCNPQWGLLFSNEILSFKKKKKNKDKKIPPPLKKKSFPSSLNLLHFAPLNSISVADLGCSAGPNTFLAVQNILDAIELKYQESENEIPKFQVFFNDHVSNDFNTLFKAFPTKRKYLIHPRKQKISSRWGAWLFLWPPISQSQYSHYFVGVPKEIMDKTSPAWNKGKISYTNSRKKVAEAYATQYAMDMESLCARAKELEVGGFWVVGKKK